jgi:tetratricopeptide (TPR) repeat protein
MSRSKQRPDPLPPRGHALARWRGPAALAGLILVLVGLAAILLPIWRRHEALGHVRAGLPAMPDAKDLPALLVERLSQAKRQATAEASTLQGAAELGRLYHASGFPQEAGICWELLRSAQPQEARWCYYLADLRRVASDYAGVAELLARTTELAPTYSPAWLQLAELQFKTGQTQDAARSYQQRLALAPGDPYARLGLARVALQEGRRAQARELIELLVKETPGFSPGHNLYAEMLAADGAAKAADRERWLGRETSRFRAADDPWLDELGAWCFNYEQLCIRGTVEYQTKHGDRGKSYFERAIQLRPNALPAYSLLGALYLELSDYTKARDVLETGLQQAGNTKPAVMYYVDLSRTYRELKQPMEAVRVARQGLVALGRQYELYDALGVSLGDSGDGAGAVEALQTAVALNPNDTNANYNLAFALLKMRQLGEAVVALQRSLVLKPTFPNSLVLLAKIEIDSGRWEESSKYLKPLYESHPEMPEARRLMAYWHLRAGMTAEEQKDPASAERHYREGVAIDQNHPDLQMRLGTLCLIQGRFADAVNPLEAYRRLQPDIPQGALFLGQAYMVVGRRDDARRVLTEGVMLAERSGNTTAAEHCREILAHLR